MRVYKIFALWLFIFSSVMYINAQTKQIVLRAGQSVCFPENGRSCGKRPPDFRYGVIQSSDEPDWFTVSTDSPIRTKMIDLGSHGWEDESLKPQNLEPLEPYPIGQREASVKFSESEVAKPEEAVSPTGRLLIKPSKIVKKSDEVVKAVEGHMYLLRVRDDIHDFYVLMRVDTIIAGKSVTISWRWFPSP